MTVSDVNAEIARLWPPDSKEPWDAVGLVSGDLDAPVSSILLAVDAVLETAAEAIELGVDVLVVHHPPLLRPVTSIASDQYKGAVLSQLIRAGCALVAAHTNADVTESGTSATLAAALGLEHVRPIVIAENPAIGIGRVGELPVPSTLGRLARDLAELLPATASGIRVSGSFDSPVRVVALCAGAGDSLLSEVDVLRADVYITSDLRHHPASEARENAKVSVGPALIDVSHWASEWLWLDVAAAQLRAALPGVRVSVSDARTDPWDFVVTQ